MANKEINFVIKVNNKEVNLSKTSFEQFDKVIKQAQKDLKSLPLTDPRYKTLNADIKSAEAAWKAAQKAASQMGDEMDKGDEKVKSYAAEIKKLTLANRELEQQGLKNSQQFEDNVQKIKKLRDAQEEMQRSTLKLDDALSNIPGPIGQIGSSMQQLETITGSAKSAFKSLGLGFDSFDKILKTSLIGFLVGLLATLVGAVMEAAKSFKPLQDAFNKIKDATGALFNALKPVTDFLLNVFTKVVEFAASAINAVAEFFGGVNNNLNQTTAAMDKNISQQEKMLKAYGDALSEYARGYSETILQFKKDINEADKAAKDGTLNMADYYDTVYFLNVQKNNKLDDLSKEWAKKQALQLAELYKLQEDNSDMMIKSEVERQKEMLKSEELFDLNLLLLDKKSAEDKKKQLQQNRYAASVSTLQNKVEVLDALDQSLMDQDTLIAYYDDKIRIRKEKFNNEIKLINQEQARISLKAKNEAQLKENEFLEYTQKNDAERQLLSAKNALQRLKESQRIELEEIELNQGKTSDVYKSAIKKQAAELSAEQEKVRKAQIERDVQYQQDVIDLEKSFLSTRAQNTQDYFDTQNNLVEMEYEKAVKAADGNKQKILIAENERNNQLKQLEIDRLQVLADLYQRHADTMQDHTKAYFDAQRDAENTEYAVRVKAAKDNVALLEIIEEEHQKKLRDLKKQEIQAYGETASAVLDSIANLGNALASTYDEEAKTSKKAFEQRKALQIATATMSAASGVIQILTQPSTLPSPFDWIVKGINAAALLISTGVQISNIKKTQFNASSSSSSGGGTAGGTEISSRPNYGDGGMIEGPRHAQGGVEINAEGGEAVMTRGAVTMFKPLLSMMNQAGGGTSFTKGASGQANYDSPNTTGPSSDQQIIKTFVVEQDLTSVQHRNARLKDLSTL
jgi:hypothetical protein